MASSAPAAPSQGFFSLLTQHPPGFWFIFWGEFAERCSYYGMRAILAKYMADKLGLGDDNAFLYMSIFIGACYFLPLLGGYLADNYLGKYRIIVIFSIPYILGHVVLGIESVPGLIVALSLLAMGSGVIKPNISTLMGLTYDQQRPGMDLLRTQAFSVFYMAINIGAAISQFAMPVLRNRYDFFIAFLFPAVLMAVAFVLFASGKRYYAVETIVRRESTPQEKAVRWKVLSEIGLVFLMVMFFWAIFDQSSSAWIFYASTFMKNDFFGMSAEQMQALNPVLIVLLLPPVNMLFTSLANKGYRIRATDKIVIGFVLTAVCMGTMAYCGYVTGTAEKRDKIDAQGQVVRDQNGDPVKVDFCPEERKVSLWYQAVAYLFLTVAEILISVTGLELAFVAAPQNMKSFVTSLWLLTVALANWGINVPISKWVYPHLSAGNFFMLMAAVMLVVTVAFVFIARRFNRTVAAQKQVEEKPAISEEEADRILSEQLPLDSPRSDGIQPSSNRDGVQ